MQCLQPDTLSNESLKEDNLIDTPIWVLINGNWELVFPQSIDEECPF